MKKGFTLLEAVVSLAVLAMLVYMASASFLNLIPKYRLELAAWEVASALNAARYKALFEGVSVRVRLLADGYIVEKYDDVKKTWQSAERHGLEGVIVSANNSPIFTPDGTVSGLATIYVANAWGKYKITLAITGRVKSARVE
jgi:prepilin-type N-terminal cleavage/methylation domain-containing protein